MKYIIDFTKTYPTPNDYSLESITAIVLANPEGWPTTMRIFNYKSGSCKYIWCGKTLTFNGGSIFNKKLDIEFVCSLPLNNRNLPTGWKWYD